MPSTQCSHNTASLEVTLPASLAVLRSCNRCETRCWYVDDRPVETALVRQLIGDTWGSTRRRNVPAGSI